MNLKKALTLLGGSIVVLALALVGFGVWTLAKLPSPYEIRKAMTPAALNTNDLPQQDIAKTLPEKEIPQGVTGPETKSENVKVSAQEEKADKLKSQGWQVLMEDFANPQAPMIESCRHLDRASSSGFLRDQENASAKYFFSSLASQEKDPLVESAAPIFRFIFRAPGFAEALTVAKKAEAESSDLLSKAEFYGNILKAGAYLRDHREDLDVVLQRTYNMHVLARAVAKRPELARDSATLNFCDQIEKAVNLGTENFDPDGEAREMSQFLSEMNIDPHSVGFDPNYRSQVKLDLSSTQVVLNDTWVIKMFAKDFERLNKAKGK